MSDKGKKKHKFTVKQQRFIKLYEGNATDAARKAGYKNPRRQGQRLLTNVDILSAIKNREKERMLEGIASREDRQLFWSQIMTGELKSKITKTIEGGKTEILEIDSKLSDRLKASELLGRSEADFTDNVKVEEVKPLVVFDEDE